MSDLVDLTIGAPAHGGHCVARLDGRVVFVRHALPGETVRARLTESGEDAKLWRADAVEIIEPSPDRVPSVWPEAGPGGVGGGELAHVSLAGQLAWKESVLRESFERFAKAPFPGVVAQVPGDAESGGLRYRTRVSATADSEGRASMAVHRSRDLRALESMPLATEAVEEALLGNRFPAGARVSIAQGSDGVTRTMVNGSPWHNGRADSRKNAARTVRQDVRVGDELAQFRVSADGFWQVHRGAAQVLVDTVLDAVGEAARVADLYAGAGLFSLPLAMTGRDVISIESDAQASRAAKRNCHHYPQVDVVHGDVRRELSRGIGPVDAVVLDPPRSGAGAKTLELVGAVRANQLVYVACDPVALARDTAILATLGYALVRAEAVDLFPMTHHMETIATFERR